MNKLYLDLDGVFADFDARLKDYEIHKNQNDFLARHKDSWTQEEKALDVAVRAAMGSPGFWLGIPLVTDAPLLWEHCTEYEPFILTALPNVEEWHERVASEKKTWVRSNLDAIPDERIICCLRSQKKNYARNNILIDDMLSNINEWNEAGGYGILHTSAKDSITRLEYIMKELLG